MEKAQQQECQVVAYTASRDRKEREMDTQMAFIFLLFRQFGTLVCATHIQSASSVLS